jgi:arsenite oxidase small subunit
MADLSRRRFLRTGGVAAAGAAIVAAGATDAGAHSTLATTLPYGRTKIGNLRALKVGTPVTVSYPDAAAPSVLLKLGVESVGGIGPDHDVVAYSLMCTHKGCPVTFNAAEKALVCPCHYSVFDPARDGQMVIGQATENLPRIELALDDKTGDIYATGVRGLLYGRAANVIRA